MEGCVPHGTWPRSVRELGRQNSPASFIDAVVFQACCTPTIHSPREEHSRGAHLETALRHLVELYSCTPNANQNYTLCGIYTSTRERNVSPPVGGGGLFQSWVFALFSPLNLGSVCPFLPAPVFNWCCQKGHQANVFSIFGKGSCGLQLLPDSIFVLA